MDVLFLVGGLLGVFVALFLSLSAIGVFTNEARGVSKSLTVIEAFSAAPPEMQRELAPSFQDRVLGPLLDRSLAMGKRVTRSDNTERIRHKLEVAGNPSGWTVDRVTSLKFLGLVLFPVIGLLFCLMIGIGFGPLLVVVALSAVLGYTAPNLYLYQVGYDRTNSHAARTARRPGPAHHLCGIRAGLRRRPVAGGAQHRRAAGR